MSINMNDDGTIQTEAASYADHEFINYGAQGDIGSGDDIESFTAFDPLAEELDSNEVAELVYYFRTVSISGGELEFGVGFNVADQDFVEESPANQTDFTLDSTQAADEVVGAFYEEPGIIDTLVIGDDEDSASGIIDREWNVKEDFNHGPYVDSTDDLDVHLEFANNSGSTQGIDVQMQLVFQTHEVAQGIPQFSDPRRMMD